MAGLGIALFHPRAAALATNWSSRQKAFGLAIFGASGTLGYALGSLIGASLYQYFGNLKGLFPSLVLGLVVAIVVAIINPEDADKEKKVSFGLRRHLLPRIGKLIPVFTVIAMRTASVTVFVNFMTLFLETKGASIIAGGGAVFLFLAGTSAGGLVGGKLSVIFDERRLTIVSLLLASPLLLMSVTIGGVLTFVCLFFAGFTLRCADYVNIAQAQAIVPEGASMAASLGMGATWGLAGLVAPLVGRLADLYGEFYALAWSAGLPLLGALIAFMMKFDESENRRF
jgi:FSR family fosmidomycin resistance protein-like MFS transporter